MSATRVTYCGHATVLIESGGVRLLTDPMLRRRILHITRNPPLPDGSLTSELDAILISHLHADHVDFPSLRKLGREARLIVPRGGARTFARRGYERVEELRPGERARVAGVEVRATEAAHDGRRFRAGRHVDALGFLIGGPAPIYFAGDTDLFAGMSELAGQVELALLPIGGWGQKVGKGHLDPFRAALAASVIEARIAIPIHYGTMMRAGLARTRPELVAGPGRRFAEQLARVAPGVEARVLAAGETLEVG